ncbi:MAG: tyrosine-type recombinase/integrase [Kiritimatiellae bacterium]|nr:tyrosine-type recombinase/integrase [Kiritimatiellia bacterium]
MRRRKGSGSLLKRNGRWVIRWRDGGKVKQEATEFAVGAEGAKEGAEALLAERSQIGRLKSRRDQVAVLLAEREELAEKIRRLEAAARGESSAPLLLGALVDAWRKSPRRRDVSAELEEDYTREIARFVKWAGKGVEMAAVDDAMAERYAVHLGKQVSGNTYNKHLVTLTAAWRAVGRAAGVRGNPWADLPRKRKDTHSRRSLTKEEVAKVLALAEGELRSLVLVGLWTGLRLGDACRLRWDAFKADGAVEVKTAKTGAVVRLPASRLMAELGKRGEGYVMPGMAAAYGRDSSAVSKRVTDLFTRAGIATREKRKGWLQSRPTASFHSLRHTFVTRCVEAGVPVAVVRELVGHTRETMTMHYTHISAEAMEAALSALAK